MAEYFDNTFILNDPLHVVYRGFAPDFVASGVMQMLRAGFWGQSNQQSRMDSAFNDAKAWVKQHRHEPLSINEFTKATLGLAEGGYPELHAKGHDVKTLVFWLATLLHVRSLFC